MKTSKIKAILAIFTLLLSGLGAGVAIYEVTKKE